MKNEERKPFDLGKERFIDEDGEVYYLYVDNDLVERKLFVNAGAARLNEKEDYLTYKYRKQFQKIVLKNRLKGEIVWRSRNYESKKLLRDAVRQGLPKEELDQYLIVSQHCNRGTATKDKLEAYKLMKHGDN
jgi:hypothetical protein